MRFVIVTGMSGAGKSTALKMLEDMGYFCVDNLPIPLLTRFVEMFSEPEEEVKKIAPKGSSSPAARTQFTMKTPWTLTRKFLNWGFQSWVSATGCN